MASVSAVLMAVLLIALCQSQGHRLRLHWDVHLDPAERAAEASRTANWCSTVMKSASPTRNCVCTTERTGKPLNTWKGNLIAPAVYHDFVTIVVESADENDRLGSCDGKQARAVLKDAVSRQIIPNGDVNYPHYRIKLVAVDGVVNIAQTHELLNLSFSERKLHGKRSPREQVLADDEGKTSVIDLLNIEESVWKRYPASQGQGVRIGIVDTGIQSGNPHFMQSQIVGCMSFTNERKAKDRKSWCEDGHGHGSFGASLLVGTQSGDERGRTSSCRPHTNGHEPRHNVGLAPKAQLIVFKVFTDLQVSMTSWFLEAFNAAIQLQVDLVNFSFGGLDYYDVAFVEKVRDMTNLGMTMVTATGNDGPRHGSNFNPADQPEAIAVGSVDKLETKVSSFSSRGMTTWELPFGVGRPRPDVLSFGENVLGASYAQHQQGCRVLSGTSMATPVVTGMLGSLTSFLREKLRLEKMQMDEVAQGNDTSKSSFVTPMLGINAAVLKQVLVATADLVAVKDSALLPRNLWKDVSVFSQGAGVANISKAFSRVDELPFRSLFGLTTFPATLFLHGPDGKYSSVKESSRQQHHEKWSRRATCRYFWPFCLQPIFFTSSPLTVNLTLYNSAAESSSLVTSTVSFEFAETLPNDDDDSEVNNQTYGIRLSSEVASSVLAVSVHASPSLTSFTGFCSVAFSSKIPLPHGVPRLRVHGTIRLRYINAPRFRETLAARRKQKQAAVTNPLWGDVEATALEFEREYSQQMRSKEGMHAPLFAEVSVPFVVDVIAEPLRSHRLVWDATASLQYPSYFVPRDDVEPMLRGTGADFADSYGDHPFTSFNSLYEFLIFDLKLHVDIVSHRTLLGWSGIATIDTPQACASHVDLIEDYLSLFEYLLIIDIEDYMSPIYQTAIFRSVSKSRDGLKAIIVGDWAHPGVQQQLAFMDGTTSLYWDPITGGATHEALNELLQLFGYAISDACVVSGPLEVSRRGSSPHPEQPKLHSSRGNLEDMPQSIGQLASAGCLYRVPSRSQARDSWSCVPSPFAQSELLDVVQFAKRLAKTRVKVRTDTEAGPTIPLWRAGHSVARPHVFAFSLFDGANAQAPSKLGSERMPIPVVDDATLPSKPSEGPHRRNGGGLFVLTDSDCLESHARSGNCFEFLRESMRVLAGQSVLSAATTNNKGSVSPLSQNCYRVESTNNERNTELLQQGGLVEEAGESTWRMSWLDPPNTTFQQKVNMSSDIVCALQHQNASLDPLFPVGRRYRDARRLALLQGRGSANEPWRALALTGRYSREAVEDEVADLTAHWMDTLRNVLRGRSKRPAATLTGGQHVLQASWVQSPPRGRHPHRAWGLILGGMAAVLLYLWLRARGKLKRASTDLTPHITRWSHRWRSGQQVVATHDKGKAATIQQRRALSVV